jgi:hypothetical protein
MRKKMMTKVTKVTKMTKMTKTKKRETKNLFVVVDLDKIWKLDL